MDLVDIGFSQGFREFLAIHNQAQNLSAKSEYMDNEKNLYLLMIKVTKEKLISNQSIEQLTKNLPYNLKEGFKELSIDFSIDNVEKRDKGNDNKLLQTRKNLFAKL